MTIELNQSEVEMVKEALDAWEKEVVSSGFIVWLLGVILTPPEMREEMKLKDEVDSKEANQKAKMRRNQATLLRSKLIQSSARASEHEEVTYDNH